MPLHLRNAPTESMKAAGYGRDYRNPHREVGHFATGETYLPEELTGARFFEPTGEGFEARIRERLDRLRSGRSPAGDPESSS